MEARICKSAAASKSTPSLLLQPFCQSSVSFATTFLLHMRSRRFMDTTLFPVFGLGLDMKHGKELRRALLIIATAGPSSRLVSLIGFIDMETAAYYTRTHTLMHLAPTSMMRRWLMRMVMHADVDADR